MLLCWQSRPPCVIVIFFRRIACSSIRLGFEVVFFFFVNWEPHECQDSGLPSRIESRSNTSDVHIHLINSRCIIAYFSVFLSNSLNCNGDGKTAGQQIIYTEESLWWDFREFMQGWGSRLISNANAPCHSVCSLACCPSVYGQGIVSSHTASCWKRAFNVTTMWVPE